MRRDGITTVFVDDGGVLNDNEVRGEQFRVLLGEYLAPRLGGSPEAWARANRPAFDRGMARFNAWLAAVGTSGGVDEWIRRDRVLWLADMCAQVGVPPPADAGRLIEDLQTTLAERIRSAIPGAIEAVRALSDAGLRLHMATGALSWEIAPYLRGMGIRDRFDRLYGPDLVDRYKNGPHFYQALLSDSGADPATSAVVDDGAAPRAWAASLGMRVHSSLAELVATLE